MNIEEFADMAYAYLREQLAIIATKQDEIITSSDDPHFQ